MYIPVRMAASVAAFLLPLKSSGCDDLWWGLGALLVFDNCSTSRDPLLGRPSVCDGESWLTSYENLMNSCLGFLAILGSRRCSGCSGCNASSSFLWPCWPCSFVCLGPWVRPITMSVAWSLNFCSVPPVEEPGYLDPTLSRISLITSPTPVPTFAMSWIWLFIAWSIGPLDWVGFRSVAFFFQFPHGQTGFKLLADQIDVYFVHQTAWSDSGLLGCLWETFQMHSTHWSVSKPN